MAKTAKEIAEDIEVTIRQELEEILGDLENHVLRKIAAEDWEEVVAFYEGFSDALTRLSGNIDGGITDIEYLRGDEED